MRKRHRRKWPEPGADLVLDLHTRVLHLDSKLYHAELTLELPTGPRTTQFYCVAASSKTERGALRKAIEEMENTRWFQHMLRRGVAFRVLGILEDTYRGYIV